jgi:hypothetical protein
MIPLLVSAGARLLPFVSKLAGAIGPSIMKFAPQVQSMLSAVTTKFPLVGQLAGKVSMFAAKNPMMTNIGSMFLPGQPLTSLGSLALTNPAAMGALKNAWMAGLPKTA